MILHELLKEEAHKSSWTPEEIKAGVEAALKSSEYAELRRLCVDVTGQIQRKRGTFEFSNSSSAHNGLLKSHSSRHSYIIYAYGSLKSGGSVLATIKAPLLTTTDLAENYRRMFQRLIDIYTSGNKTPLRTYEADPNERLKGFEEQGKFLLINSGVTTLAGAPEVVSEYRIRACRNLKTLEGGPREIIGTNGCTVEKCDSLVNLKGAPTKTDKSAGVYYTLDGLPALKSLEGLETAYTVRLNSCPALTSFEGIGDKYLRACERVYLNPMKVTSHTLGFCLIKGLREVNDTREGKWVDGKKVMPKGAKWFEILQQVLADYQDHERLIEYQHALIDAGLEEFAKL